MENESSEPFLQVKMESIVKLKDSTKKLLCLLEEIQTKTHSKIIIPDDMPNISESIKPVDPIGIPTTVSGAIGAGALKKLEIHARALDGIYIENEDDDCSVFKRLTRKCVCLNQQEYNDLIIHFNEDTRYFTSTIGEIIKNLRILKKFLYMGGGYSKNALVFLNEGLSDSSHAEKVTITQGVAYADVCNVFDEYSIVTVCIAWPCKYENYGDPMSQNLAASLLNKLAQLEEGRRYLNFTSKITNDIKRLLRKKSASLEYDILESLNATLNMIHPPMAQNVNVTYYCRPMDEGFGNKTVQALLEYRKYMTLDEVFMHLDLLHNICQSDKSKTELTSHLPALLVLFKHMLLEYDNSEMNIIVTNILNNIVAKNILKEEDDLPKTMIVADIGTEPIKMKNESNQIPPAKRANNAKHKNKSKSHLGTNPNKFRQASRRKVTDWESPRQINRSKKFTKAGDSSFIVVPIEK